MPEPAAWVATGISSAPVAAMRKVELRAVEPSRRYLRLEDIRSLLV